MITKQCQFSGRDDQGIHFHLVHPGYNNDQLIKTAEISPPQLAQIQSHLKRMNKVDGWVYTLVSALGAGEFWGSNSNADYFGMGPLIHTPVGWDQMNPAQQKLQGARWEWGYPTFYNAHAFQHHTNKDPARAFGTVEYTLWDPRMKRVLLITGLNRAKARKEGAIDVIDRVENGEYPDVSMGCKVPFDCCSICCDLEKLMPYMNTPQRIVQMHKRSPIQGISCTTNEYCQHLKFELNKIYPDGRKVMMLNMHPRFFDISYVFIGADKTSKVLAKLAQGRCPVKNNAPMCKQGCTMCNPQGVVPSSHVYEVWSKTAGVNPARGTTAEPVNQPEPTTQEDVMDSTETRQLNRKRKVKTAEDVFEHMLHGLEKTAYGLEDFDIDPAEEDEVARYYRKQLSPGRLIKRSEIDKRVTSHFGGKVLPALEKEEPDLPEEVLEEIGKNPEGGLATAGSLGMVLKPKEFQRTILISCGKRDMADDLEAKRLVFPTGGKPEGSPLASTIIPRILQALLPMMGDRSAFGPALHKRVIIRIHGGPPGRGGPPMSSCEHGAHPLMDKLSSMHTDYRRGLIYGATDLVKQATELHPQILQDLLGDSLLHPFGGGLVKEGGDVMELLLGSIPVAYLNQAYTNSPISAYVQEHPGLDGITNAGGLAIFGGVA